MLKILETIVGSRAHGTETPASDTDLRSIYVVPTNQIVGIGNYDKYIENKEADENSWELAKFIYLSLRCNPTCLEVLLSEPSYTHPYGNELRALFPAFLNRKHAYNAFKGFAVGQRKKMMSPTTNYFRKPKAAAHYIRVLYNGIELLQTGKFSVRIADTSVGWVVKAAKNDELDFESIVEIGDKLLDDIHNAYLDSTIQEECDKAAINEFLVKVRKEYW